MLWLDSGRVTHGGLPLCCHQSRSTYSIDLLIPDVVFLELEDNGTAQHRGAGSPNGLNPGLLVDRRQVIQHCNTGREISDRATRWFGNRNCQLSRRWLIPLRYPDPVSLD